MSAGTAVLSMFQVNSFVAIVATIFLAILAL
jgi:hypothetical protein